jgi:hypothetical protein
MQFKKSSDTLAGLVPARVSGYPRSRRPKWLVEWVNERGQYVMLACGHLDSFADADTTACLIRTFQGLELLCSICEQFSEVTKSVSLFDYMDISKPVISSNPLF